jgi:hypothetical protein
MLNLCERQCFAEYPVRRECPRDAHVAHGSISTCRFITGSGVLSLLPPRIFGMNLPVTHRIAS